MLLLIQSLLNASLFTDLYCEVYKLSTHIDELKILLGENPIDVLAINETKLDDFISDNEVYIPGYEIVTYIHTYTHLFRHGKIISVLQIDT